MPPTFGKRIVGEEAYFKAVESHKGGADVFGKRVVGQIPALTGELAAKANSQFGFRVIEDAEFQDHRGEKTDAVALDDLQDILNENPTFFDSLYEAEMARADGPRQEALRIFAVVENGIKGAGRQHILDEINGYLGIPQERAKAAAQEERERVENYKAMAQRNKENLALLDTDRLLKIADREEAVEVIRKSKSPQAQAVAERLDEIEDEIEEDEKPKKAGGDKREQAGESLPVDTTEAGGGMAGAGKGAKGKGKSKSK